jgi:glycolate oxidase
VSRLPSGFAARVAEIVGGPFVFQDAAALETYGADALKAVSLPDLVALPGSTREVAAVARLCDANGVPMVVRGAGTGYTGGAIPIHGGLVLALQRLNRILEIDQVNLLARVQPNVITADLQAAVEAVGLFYPPDPASLKQSAIGGNVAECAGGPRAFKYGTTKRYVLALEAVLPTGQIVRTGSKAVKNVVGYDLTQLLVGSEGTLAIITEITLRLIPKPLAAATLMAEFRAIGTAVDAVTNLIQKRVVPSSVELIDDLSLQALADHAGQPIVSSETRAALIVEVDGSPESVEPDIELVDEACRTAGATVIRRAANAAERDEIWDLRRELSPALKTISPIKLNNDVVVPRGRIPELFRLVGELQREFGLPIASFGHAGDGNIHVNIMVPPGDADANARARSAEARLFAGVVALEGSISGEHGIGITKKPYIGLELSPEELALMKRVKAAFDPHGILNPGKIFPDG